MTPETGLVTARLAFRRLTADDLDLLAALHGDPDVTRYLGGVKTREEAAELLRTRVLAYYDQHPGLGVWATLDRHTGDCLGVHVLNHIQGEDFIQVGFILRREAWGRGLATEGARALLDYGFTTLQLPQIVGITDLDNAASQRVLEKVGLHRRGERAFTHPAYHGHGPFAWFERDRAGWAALPVVR
jgi:[ribosomal protein S5]-alanine N-acetyltransferase